MSRALPVRPRDPLLKRLYDRRYAPGQTITTTVDQLTAHGCPASWRAVQHWLVKQKSPGRLLRPMLARALDELEGADHAR